MPISAPGLVNADVAACSSSAERRADGTGSPEYLLDVASSAVYWKRTEREIVARTMVEP